MSRVAKAPILVPAGVKVDLRDRLVVLSGQQGSLQQKLPKEVEVQFDANILQVKSFSADRRTRSLAGTIRAHLNNHVKGVSEGFSCTLNLVGVGYRAQMQDKALILNVGYSKLKAYPVPEGVSIECPSLIEIIVKGMNLQQVHQVAAEIRRIRPPEPYHGSGIRLKTEIIVLKETKKK